MEKSIFCFFHIGDDIRQPQMLVDSIKKFNNHSEVIHCTDAISPNINGVDQRLEFKGNPSELMTFRLKSFAYSDIGEPAIYLDTDMLCLKKFSPTRILGKKDFYVCERVFNKNAVFNEKFRGMNYSEYRHMTLGEVYPYLACATITKNSKIWIEFLDICDRLNEKFKIWYGDQEALKISIKNKSDEQYGFLPEHIYACLPENLNDSFDPFFLHFKGVKRKELMLNFYKKLMFS